MEGPTASKEIRPANVYDLAANETWLEDQAAQGWHLTGMTGWGAAFEKGEPRSVRYRMQPVPGKEKQGPPEEVRALYAELGWAYVCNLSGIFRVWRCEDPAVPELDTDPVVQELGYGYLKRRMFWDLLTSLLLLAVLGGSVGAVAGMFHFHHKTRHWYFRWGLPALLLLQLAATGALWHFRIQ